MVKHERCPKCAELGKDTKGDNLARYPNGGAWCFSCGHLEKPTHWKPKEEKTYQEPPLDLTHAFGQANYDWLAQYLTRNEIFDNFKYSPSMERHVFMRGNYWEARSVNNKPKVISHGEKPFLMLNPGMLTMVVVEDVVSAIKVSRFATGIPLFGSHLSGDWMKKIADQNPKRVIVWLDHDKVVESRKFADKLRYLGLKVASITSFKDPKCYENNDLKEYLGV